MYCEEQLAVNREALVPILSWPSTLAPRPSTHPMVMHYDNQPNRQPGSLNPGCPRPIRKMRPFRYRFATVFRNANFKLFGANSLRRSRYKTVAFYRANRTEPNASERLRQGLRRSQSSHPLTFFLQNRTFPDEKRGGVRKVPFGWSKRVNYYTE